MSLFRRRPRPPEPRHHARATESATHAWPVFERAPLQVSGVASGSARLNFPYEFETDDGVLVRLHDMQLLGFDYQVTSSTMTMRFAYDDPQWTPTEARATPVAVFRFSGVQVWTWEDDFDLLETPSDVRGQVGDFGYYPPTNVFSLATLNTSLLFSASRLTVTMESAKDP